MVVDHPTQQSSADLVPILYPWCTNKAGFYLFLKDEKGSVIVTYRSTPLQKNQASELIAKNSASAEGKPHKD